MALEFDNEEDGFQLFSHSRAFDQGGGKIRAGANVWNVALDGTGDFTTIHEALSALPSTGGAIYIKEGTYIVDKIIEITKSNVTITGAGEGTIISGNFPDAGLWSIFKAENVDHIIIQDLKMTQTAFVDYAIHLINCDHAIMRRLFIPIADKDGIFLDDCSYGLVNDVYFENCGSDFAVCFKSTSEHCIIKNCFLNNSGPILIEGASYCSILGNSIKNPKLDGVLIFDQSDNNIIANNIIEDDGTGQYGIQLELNADQTIITGNNIKGIAVGIVIGNANCNNTIVNNNMLKSCTAGITDNGTDTTIDHNITP